jgi:hypothetical protein
VGLAVEVAETASRHAYISGVDVAVYLPSYNLSVGNLLGT